MNDRSEYDPLGIYIHIPFCRSKCGYCDFNSYAGMFAHEDEYIDAVLYEIKTSPCRAGYADTVYIGGGTPTCIKTEGLIKILDAVRDTFMLSDNAEITAECNPGTADFDKLCVMRDAGINRLSIGCQSADDAMLRTLGRIHNFADFTECFSAARQAGFDNISVDLMFGLPGQTVGGWLDTLAAVTAFKPDHISAYALKIEEGTPFYALYHDGGSNIPSPDQSRDMYDAAVDFLSKHGYGRYEISNFAKGGKRSRHNLHYWKRDDYIGFGAGAASCIKEDRSVNIAPICDYMRLAMRGGAKDPSQSFVCTKKDMMSEFAFLGLRLDEGIDKKEFARRFGTDIYEVFPEALKKHLGKTLTDTGDAIRLLPEYTFVSNAVMSDFV